MDSKPKKKSNLIKLVEKRNAKKISTILSGKGGKKKKKKAESINLDDIVDHIFYYVTQSVPSKEKKEIF